MSRNQSNDGTVSSLIFISLVLLVIIGLSLGQTSDPAIKPFSNGAGVDIVPGITDLNPAVKGRPFAQGVPFGNYNLYFEDPGFSAHGLGIMIFGFFANIFFMGAVFLSKLFTLFLNFSLNSSLIADIGSGATKYVGNFGSNFLTKMFGILLPIGYGSWTIYKGFIQKKYTTAVLGILGAIMVFSVGNMMLTKSDQILKGMTTTSSKLGQSFMQLTSGAEGTVNPIVSINDNIWVSQIYVPWSIMQFGQTGLPADMSKMRNSDGTLNLQLPMNAWEKNDINEWWDNDNTIIGVSNTGDWATTLFSSIKPNSKGKSAIADTLNNKDNPRVNGKDGSVPWQPDTGAAMINSFILIIVNLVQSIIMGAMSIIVILADVILVVSMLASFIIFFLALVPSFGARIYKAFLSIIVSAFIAKIIYGSIIGFYTMIVTATYISMYNMMGGSQFAILFAGFVSIMINAGFIGLGWFLVKKVGISPLGSFISMGTLATNFATGNVDAARAQLGDFRNRFGEIDIFEGKYNPLRQLAENMDFNKYIRGIDPEEHIIKQLSELNKSYITNGELSEKEEGRLDNLTSQADNLYKNTKDAQESQKYRNLSLSTRKLKAEIKKEEFGLRADEYLMGAIAADQYMEEKNKIQDIINDLMSGDNDSKKIARELNDMIFERDAEINQKQIEDFIKENPYNSASFEKRRSEFFALLDKADKGAKDGLNSTDNQKTGSRLNKVRAFVEEEQRQLFMTDYSQIADSHKLDYLREHLDDERFGAFARREYDNHKLHLLDQVAGTFTESQQREFWKSEIAQETSKDETIRDNKIIEHAKKKLEVTEFADLEQRSKVILDSGRVYSSGQLTSLIDTTESYLHDVAVSGHLKQQASSILGKARLIQKVSELGQQDPQTEIESLMSMIQLPDYKDHARLITERLADIQSNQFKADVLDALRNGSVQPDHYIADLQAGLQNEMSSVTADKAWMKEVVNRKQQALELISKDIDGYIGESTPVAVEPMLLEYVDQISRQAGEDTRSFINGVREKLETQTIEKASSILAQIKNEISQSFVNADDLIKQELQLKFEIIGNLQSKSESLVQSTAAKNEWNFDEDALGFKF